MDETVNTMEHDILKAIETKGPLQPSTIVQMHENANTTIIGAYLSKLLDEKKILFTHVKRGTSPFYYTNNQLESLEKLTIYLNEKDKATQELLKEKKIMKDDEQTPLIRVSLSQIKDYAKPLKVKINGELHKYWRYYLVSETDAINMIKASLKKEPQSQPQQSSENKPIQTTITEKSNQTKENVQQESSEINKTSKHTETEVEQTDFLKKILDYLKEKNVQVEKINAVKKNSEYQIDAIQQTAFGKAPCLICAKKKAKINDSDISQAYLDALTMQIPLVYLTTGKITKKAEQNVQTKYKNAVVKKIK